MQKKREKRENLPRETYTVKIERDAITGVVVEERWLKDGLPHREGGPAAISRDPITGVAINESWWKSMQLHREEGPACILRKPDGRVYWTEWYLNGEKIRPPRHAQRAWKAGAGQVVLKPACPGG